MDYPIANGEQPIVVAKVSMNDLIVIENEEPHGAAVNARKRNFFLAVRAAATGTADDRFGSF